MNDLSNHEYIRAAHASGPVPWRLIGPDGLVSVPATGRFSANTGQAQREAGAAGLGICLLPANAVADSMRSDELVEVLPGLARNMGNLYVVYSSRRHIPRAVTTFVDMTIQRLEALNMHGSGV